jgi:hypothetical protein
MQPYNTLVSPPGVTVNLPSIWGWSIEVKRTVSVDANAFIIICIADDRDGTGKK